MTIIFFAADNMAGASVRPEITASGGTTTPVQARVGQNPQTKSGE